VNELRGDCRLERVNLRHKEVSKHVTERNINFVNCSSLGIIHYTQSVMGTNYHNSSYFYFAPTFEKAIITI